MNVVERRQPVKHWHQEGAEMHVDMYVIWSIEHQAWWRAGRCGYCATLLLAGYYTKAHATQIVADANRVALNECVIPVAALAGGRDAL